MSQDLSDRLGELFICSLVIISIVLVVVISVITLSPGWLFTLYAADLFVCLAFAWDFVCRFRQAPQKTQFLKFHVYELLTMVPAAAFYHAGQLIPLTAVLRALRLIGVFTALARKRKGNIAPKTLRML